MKFLENTFNISQFFKPCLDLEKEDKVKVEENEVLKISGEKSNKHIRVEEINCNKLKEATVSVEILGMLSLYHLILGY